MSKRQLSPAQIAQVQQDIYSLLVKNPELIEDDILRADMIEAETGAFDLLRKIEAMRREAVMLAGGIATTIAELDARLGRYERREEGLRELGRRIMDTGNLRKAELPEATYSIRPSPPRVIISDDMEIPEAYMRIRKEPMKVEIKEALKAGKEIPGCTLSNQPDVLSIRTK